MKNFRKARKEHCCDLCNKKINKGDEYYIERIYPSHTVEGFYSYDFRECAKCVDERPKRQWKIQQHKERVKKRAANCPDANFKYIWQGGWDDGIPDGGDVRLECSGCNIGCVK